jgi:hypothetical protein
MAIEIVDLPINSMVIFTRGYSDVLKPARRRVEVANMWVKLTKDHGFIR